MRYFDYTHALPEMNLKIDETLLARVNDGLETPVLRTWASPSYFVVLGYSSKLEDDVEVENCTRDGIPILRRCSGGGTVIQGPGCLNYAVIDYIKGTLDLSANTCEILKKIRNAFAPLPLEVKGMSDVVLNGKKCIGNAERRKKNAYLFHGSILYDFNIPLMSTYLKIPPKQPAYRNHQPHEDFLTNLPLKAAECKERLRQQFIATYAE